jgi:uncharacterized protein (TIGR03083 family)
MQFQEGSMSDISPDEPITTENVLRHLVEGWDALQAFLVPLTDEQLTGPSDAVGWTVRDHLIHLATGDAGIVALLNGTSRIAAMGVDSLTWETGDDDLINDVIRQRYQSLPLPDVLALLRQSHEHLVQKIASMSDADLVRPYQDFDPDSDQTGPVVGWIVGNSFRHYDEHLPWMAAIIKQG